MLSALRLLRADIRIVAEAPQPDPPTFQWLSAVLLDSICRHPWRFALVWLGVPLLAWLSGYDVRG